MMKDRFYKTFMTFCIFTGIFSMTACSKTSMENPWSDCQQDLNCAANAAGFQFPMVLSNFQVKAMDGMIEIVYPLDEKRELTVRKSSKEINNGDISGDYNNYPITGKIKLDNGVILTVRRDTKFIYVAYFAAEQGYYSMNCAEGMTLKEVRGIYNIIAEVEAPKATMFGVD